MFKVFNSMTYRGLAKNSQNTSLKKGRINRKRIREILERVRRSEMLSDANYAIN